MPFFSRRSEAAAVLLALLVLAAPLGETGHGSVGHPSHRDAKYPGSLSPEDGARLTRAEIRFEVEGPGRGLDPLIIVSPSPFNPSSWAAVPAAFDPRACPEAGLDLDAFPLPAALQGPLWWAALWIDPRTGACRVSEVRSLTVLPPFSNRTATGLTPRPANTGRLPERVGEAAGRRGTLQLGSGHALHPLTTAEKSGPAGGASIDSAPRPYVVRSGDPSPEAARRRLGGAGVEVGSWLPGGSCLVVMDGAARARVMEDDPNAWIEPWRPEYKLSPLVAKREGAWIPLLALVSPAANRAALAERLEALGATRVGFHDNGINALVRFDLPTVEILRVAALDDLLWLEPVPRMEPLNASVQWVVQTGEPDSRRMWDHGLRGRNQIVMVSDTGLRADHSMFVDPLLPIEGFGDFPGHRKIVSYRRGADEPAIGFGDEYPLSYHGTHVCGTVAGNDEGIAASPHDGVAPDARLYFMDLSPSTSPTGLTFPADLNDLFLPSYEGNEAGAARISSNSWGAPTDGEYTLQSMQVDQFMWDHPDYLVLMANGNSGFPATVSSPASAKNCLSVGGTGNGEAETWIYTYTSRGPTRDLRVKPTLCAPGEGVTSAFAASRFAYATYSGTSMATPAAAGGLALIRQYLTEGWYPTGAPVPEHAVLPSAALLKAMAVNAGENDVLGYNAPDMNVGFGRLNLDRVLHLPGDRRGLRIVDATEGLLDREFVEYTIPVTDSDLDLTVSLCWTDRPGHPAVVRQLVNDLDLIVTDGAATYRGNRYSRGFSVPGGSRDSINVEECVRIREPHPGLWTVRVEAAQVIFDRQPFALCITGRLAADPGVVALERFTYGLSDTVRIEVVGPGGDTPPELLVRSDTEPDGEPVPLTGTDGVYRGEIVIAPVPAQAGDRLLAVSDGDGIRVTAEGSPDSPSATARVDARPPHLREVRAVALNPTSAAVTWSTDRPATSRVRYRSAAGPERDVESGRLVREHRLILRGLEPGTSYTYEVESRSAQGGTATDDFGGEGRILTSRESGDVALVIGGTLGTMLETWTLALDRLGYTCDVFLDEDAEAPPVGDAARGLRRYQAVIWQVNPNGYPPLTDVQRAAVDSLIEGGGRLLLCGHDLAFGFADPLSPTRSPEREAWVETRLKTRYLLDVWAFGRLSGVPGDPVSGPDTLGVPYYAWFYGGAGDRVELHPGTDDGAAAIEWREDFNQEWLPEGSGICGVRWESATPRGSWGGAAWGGRRSRLLSWFFEWTAVGSIDPDPDPARTAILDRALAWLIESRPPRVELLSPRGGEIVTSDTLAVRFTTAPGEGGPITARRLHYSLDGGASWLLLDGDVTGDAVYLWDLSRAGGGSPVPNTTRARLRFSVTGGGSPALHGSAETPIDFTIARPGGDLHGPVLVAGSAGTMPSPLVEGVAGTLAAVLTDAETGGGSVVAAEWSEGPAPAPPGAGTAMEGEFGAATAQVRSALPAAAPGSGDRMLWIRGRDAGGAWGPASPLLALVARLPIPETPVPADYLGPSRPNPFHGSTTWELGLAAGSPVRLDLFDVRGRRVRTLDGGRRPAGRHGIVWDGRDDAGSRLPAGTYFARLVTESGSHTSRTILLP